MRVYILSTYEEHGAEYVRASTSKEIMKTIFESNISDYLMEMDGWTQENRNSQIIKINEWRIRLNELLREDEIASKEGKNLGNGWGGFQLHIIELE